jgi:hypothetical protein
MLRMNTTKRRQKSQSAVGTTLTFILLLQRDVQLQCPSVDGSRLLMKPGITLRGPADAQVPINHLM